VTLSARNPEIIKERNKGQTLTCGAFLLKSRSHASCNIYNKPEARGEERRKNREDSSYEGSQPILLFVIF
jgi:hypothetical protein